MDKELLAMLCALFGVENATEADIKQKVTALTQSKGQSPVALSQVYGELSAQSQKVAALTAQVNTPDPAKFVPVEQVAALQAEFSTLKQGIDNDKKSAVITAALAQGKLAPALKEWAESLSIEALTGYLDKATPIAALAGGHQATDDPNKTNVAALTAAEQAAARALGMSEAEFIKEHKEQR